MQQLLTGFNIRFYVHVSASGKGKKRLLIKLHLFVLRQQAHEWGSTEWKWEDFISYKQNVRGNAGLGNQNYKETQDDSKAKA